MTLKEAYKQWSQQKENYQLFIKTKRIFGEVWSHAPFHLECSEYSATSLAQYLLSSNNVYDDKVKATNVMIHVLNFGLFGYCNFNMDDILRIHNNKPKNEDKSKPQPDIFKPLKYNNKPLIPQQEIPKLKPKVTRQSKPVYQLDKDGSLIKEWSNVKEVASTLNLKESTLYKAISAGFKVNGSFWSRTPELMDKGGFAESNKPKEEITTTNTSLISQLKEVVGKLRKNGVNISVTINI